MAYSNSFERKVGGISHPLMSVATFLLCVFATNADLGSNRLVWWGSVGFFVLSWLLTSDMKLSLDLKYTMWIISFFGFAACSVFWAISVSLVTNTLKSAIVHVLVLLLLRSSIKTKDDIDRMVLIIIWTSIVNSVYIFAISFSSIISSMGGDYADRLGTAEGWNANSVGMMAAVGALFAIYYMLRTRKTSMKIILFLVACGMVFVSLMSGSRKAFLIVLVGIAAYLFLVSGKRRLTSFLLLAAFALVLIFVVMKVPFFYSIIGWRIDGMLESLLGNGSGDASFQNRKILISAAIDAWKREPIFGHGLDCFRTFGKIAADGKNYYAHNNYLELLADLGIIGASIYYSAHFYVAKKLLKRFKEKDHTAMLLLTLLGTMLIIDFACVSYVDFLFEIVIMILFAFITIQDAEKKGEIGCCQ